MQITTRLIAKKDNTALAVIIRNTFDEFDIPKVGTVYADASTDHLYELFETAEGAYFVAERNDELLGGCGYFHTEGLPADCAELVKLYISPSARGEGLGRRLLEESAMAAKKAGYKRLYLESFPGFASAIKLYEKLGFIYLKEAMGNSGHTSCNVWMIKDL